VTACEDKATDCEDRAKILSSLLTVCRDLVAPGEDKAAFCEERLNAGPLGVAAGSASDSDSDSDGGCPGDLDGSHDRRHHSEVPGTRRSRTGRVRPVVVFTAALLPLAAGVTVACGGNTSETPETGSVPGEAASTDAGLFPCGDAFCEQSQVCFTPAYGCGGLRLLDGNVCPEGWEYSADSGACAESPPPASCVSPPDGAAYSCIPAGDSTGCGAASVPLPSDCSHVCQGICF
jgi:hypothetical protein